MINVTEARAMTNEFKAKEIAKINETAEQYANLIGEEIAEAAKNGKSTLDFAMKGDLIYDDIRVIVLKILKNNGFYVDSNWRTKNIHIAW
jgi:hypothetical protein